MIDSVMRKVEKAVNARGISLVMAMSIIQNRRCGSVLNRFGHPAFLTDSQDKCETIFATRGCHKLTMKGMKC